MQSAASETTYSEVKSSAPAAAQHAEDGDVPLQILEIIKRLKQLSELLENKKQSEAESLASTIVASLHAIPALDKQFNENEKGWALVKAFQQNKFDRVIRENLLEYLKKYLRVLLYCFDPTNELLQPQNGTHWYVNWGGRITAVVGALSGETRSVISGIVTFIGHHLVNFAQKIVELSSGFQTFTLFLSRLPAWSYYFYGASAFCYGIRALVALASSNTPNQLGLTMPHRYRVSGWLSAGANFAVFGLYAVVGLILAGTIATPVGWTMGIAMLVATVGTVISWLGNECIAAYRAAKEYDEAIKLQEDFPERKGGRSGLINAKHEKDAEFKRADRHKFLGAFMAIGMALMAIACFAPVVPFLSVPIIAGFPSISLSTVISALSLAAMITYASDGIASAVAGIQSVATKAWNKLVSCCCTAKDDATAADVQPQPKDVKRHKHSQSEHETSLKRRNSLSSPAYLGDALGRPISKTAAIEKPALLKPSDFKRGSAPRVAIPPLSAAQTSAVLPPSVSKEPKKRRQSFSR